MKDQVLARIIDLLGRGQTMLASQQRGHGNGLAYWVQPELSAQAHALVLSTANAVSLVSPTGSSYVSQMEGICKDNEFKHNVSWSLVRKTVGLLSSVREEIEQGLLTKLEYIVVATTFDDFLEHAAEFHRANQAREAGVLAAVVLEDTIKRISTKNGIVPVGKSMDALVDLLVKAGVFTPVKAKRVKGYVGVRNPALHAEWEKFDIKDAGELINGTRELIETFL